MESDLYSHLEKLNNTLRQNLSQVDLNEINRTIILGLSQESCLKKIFKKDSIFVFAIEKFLSLRNSNFSYIYIEDKLTCLNILKAKVSEELIVTELIKIKNELKIKAFDLEFPSHDFNQCCRVLESSSEFIKLVFDSDILENFKNAKNILNYLRNYLDGEDYYNSEIICQKVEELFDLFKNSKKSFIKKISQALTDIINKSKLNKEIKNGLVSLVQKLFLKCMNVSKLENLCYILDKIIKRIFISPSNPDNFEANFGDHNLATLKIDEAIIENGYENCLKQATVEFGNYRVNYTYENLIYIDFDTMFAYTINMLLIILKHYESYEFLKSNAETKLNGLNFSKAYHFLKILPIHVSQTVLEMLCAISDFNFQKPLLKYFLKDMYNLQYQKICLEDCEKFITLALKSPIVEVLQRFNKSSIPLEEILRKVTPNIYFMTFPEKIAGITLKTQLISIKLYDEAHFSKDHRFGGYFIVYLHELGHFLQRVGFTKVDESNRRISPEIDLSRPLEGGRYLEKLIFGEVQDMIYFKQSEYLIKGEFPNEIEAFIKQYKEAKIGDSMEPLVLSKSQDILVLGSCGSIYGRVEEYFGSSSTK